MKAVICAICALMLVAMVPSMVLAQGGVISERNPNAVLDLFRQEVEYTIPMANEVPTDWAWVYGSLSSGRAVALKVTALGSRDPNMTLDLFRQEVEYTIPMANEVPIDWSWVYQAVGSGTTVAKRIPLANYGNPNETLDLFRHEVEYTIPMADEGSSNWALTVEPGALALLVAPAK